jgi:general secretion pathway protein M
MSVRRETWWRTRTLRERRLLLFAAALLITVLLWLLVVRPLGDALSRAQERHGQAARALAEARAQAALIERLEGRTAPALGLPLEALITQSATEAGFPIARVQSAGPSVATFASISVRPQAFFAWVGQMETGRGLAVERLNATTNSDRTLSVEVTFRARSR